jgi:hypothetical protein
MASPKAEAIAREQAEQERAAREDGMLKTLRRIERKLDALLGDEADDEQAPLEVPADELAETPTLVPVTAADGDGGDEEKADDKKTGSKKTGNK